MYNIALLDAIFEPVVKETDEWLWIRLRDLTALTYGRENFETDVKSQLPQLLEEFSSLRSAIMDPKHGSGEDQQLNCDKWGMFLGRLNVIFTHTETVT